MNEIKIGRVTQKEKYEILSLYERIIAIQEIATTVENKDVSEEMKERLINKIKVETLKTKNSFNEWWNKKAKKYKWEKNNKESWRIDFKTNEIYSQTNN